MATEDVLTALDRRFGFRVDFPNIFNFECGLKTSRGIASYRAVQSLYQAWQTRQLAVHVGGSRILEIGAGLGRNTYYARKFGLEHYTIVDIPTTQLAQGYYLGRVMGADHVSLCGESDRNIRLRSPAWLRQTSDTFDVVVNVDSLTEMDRGQATDYVAFARARSRAMLSINHEFNHFTVAELFEQAGDMAVTRAQYWARPGYVEEVFLTRIHQEAMEAKNALAAMLASTSWRATAPLRRIKSRLWGP
jgi:SAM-dependent methyltransferase